MRFRSVLASLCTLLWFAATGTAQITIQVPADQPTIQAAMDAAHNGDTVLVAPGLYNENIDFKGKLITVVSSGGPAGATIHGNDASATVSFQSGEDRGSVIQGFTITGGGGPSLGSHGGIFVLRSSPSILFNLVSGAGCNGITSLAGAPFMEGNRVRQTHADPTMGSCNMASGSGVWISGMDDTLVAQKTFHGHYPALFMNTFEDNTEAGSVNGELLGGAGICISYGASVLLQFNIIRNNSLNPNATYGGNGGGVLVANAGAVLVNNLVYSNSALQGGGIYILNAVYPDVPSTLINNTVAENTLTRLSPETGYLPSSAKGSQLTFNTVSAFALINNILAGSSTDSVLECVPITAAGPSLPAPVVTASNNDVSNSNGPIFPPGSTCPYPLNSRGNLSVDPGFVNAGAVDFHIASGSPVIDAGDNNAFSYIGPSEFSGLGTDLDGNQRIQNATGKSTAIIDMGAYELPGSRTPPPPPPGPAATQTTLTATPNPAYAGQNISLTMTVSATGAAVPLGTVSVYDGSTLLGTLSLNGSGQATLQTSGLLAGMHTLSAVFAGNSNFLTSTSPSVQASVLASGFTLALQPASLTLASSASGSIQVTLGSTGAFAGPLTLSTGALPSGVQAHFSPQVVTLAAGQTLAAALQITCATQSSLNALGRSGAAPRSGSSPSPWYALLLLPFALPRRGLRRTLLCLAIPLLLLPLSGCGSLRIPFASPVAETTAYTIPVIATDTSGHQQTINLALTVSPN